MRILTKKNKRYTLIDDGLQYTLPKDCVDDGKTDYYVFTICIMYKDKVIEYDKKAYCPPMGTNIVELGKRLTQKIPGVRYFDDIKKAPLGKIVLISKKITFDEYKASYMKLRAKCLMCSKESIILGNTNFQKKLAQVPGSKNMFYTCSIDCRKEYKHHMSMMNGDTTKEVRKRYHQAMYSDVYGYVYGIYNKVTKMWYVGKVARSPFARWEEHMMKNKTLSQLNIADVRFEILYTCMATGDGDRDIEDLWNHELKFIQKYDSIACGYNIQKPSPYIKKADYDEEFISNEELYKIMIGGKEDE